MRTALPAKLELRRISFYRTKAKKLHKKLGEHSPGLMKCQHQVAKEAGYKNWGALLINEKLKTKKDDGVYAY